MSAAATTPSPATEQTPAHASTAQPRRRVREEVLDGLAVVLVSALASTALAALLVLVTTLVG